MKLTKYTPAYLIVIAAVMAVGLFYLLERPQAAYGSVSATNEYQATTTYGAVVPVERNLVKGSGSLGQVTITGANTGLMTFYDATTSSVLLRTGQKATSTIIIADFPASTAAGSYTFDARFSDGLLVVVSGTPATSTITYRQD